MLRAGAALLVLCVAASTGAAQAPKSIDPGMSEAKVVERLGQPDLTRSSGDFKYLYYHNGCTRQCGVDDVVMLQKDSVVDAIFRSADRTYTGKSSSPRSISAEVAARTRPRARDIPSGEVVQAGAPRAEAPPKHETMPDSSAKAAKPDSTPTDVSKPKQANQKPASKAESSKSDSTTHDTVTGTLRIPVKPQHHSTKADTMHADSAAKRPPHEH